jgi:iron complex transport system substrate-binding protein
MRVFSIVIFACWLCVLGCTPKQSGLEVGVSSVNPIYATGFSATPYENALLVSVHKPYPGATEPLRYLLVKKGEKPLRLPENVPVIEVPIARLVCTSTTHIPLLDYLGETQALVGFPTTDYISSERMRKRIDSGYVKELGVDKSINIELLTALRPEVVMGYSLTGDYGQYKKMEELNIPVIINAEYLEPHPLGRAEWIKFMALFFNKSEEADSIFSHIEKSYLSTAHLIDTLTNRPTVLSGIVYNDAWFLPGGENYSARLLKDAGYRYLWENDSSSGFLQLSFETVYHQARNADYWIGVASFKSLQEISNADLRYTQFKPFTTGQVYTYDKRQGPTGGSEFLEIGYLRPDLILKDLVKINRPGLLPDHELYFFGKLE